MHYCPEYTRGKCTIRQADRKQNPFSSLSVVAPSNVKMPLYVNRQLNKFMKTCQCLIHLESLMYSHLESLMCSHL